jgi:hypothetical protein
LIVGHRAATGRRSFELARNEFNPSRDTRSSSSDQVPGTPSLTRAALSMRARNGGCSSPGDGPGASGSAWCRSGSPGGRGQPPRRGLYKNANLGRFRLSASGDPAIFERERKRVAARNRADPWAMMASAYHLSGDQGAVDRLVKRHPEAASGVGDP